MRLFDDALLPPSLPASPFKSNKPIPLLGERLPPLREGSRVGVELAQTTKKEEHAMMNVMSGIASNLSTSCLLLGAAKACKSDEAAVAVGKRKTRSTVIMMSNRRHIEAIASFARLIPMGGVEDKKEIDAKGFKSSRRAVLPTAHSANIDMVKHVFMCVLVICVDATHTTKTPKRRLTKSKSLVQKLCKKATTWRPRKHSTKR